MDTTFYLLSLEAFLATAFISTQLYLFFRQLAEPKPLKQKAKDSRPTRR